MNSKEINEAICKIDEDGLSKQNIYKSSIGEKIIPYIGWFWRNIDFDADSVWLGVLPEYKSQFEKNDKVRCGFMENNKWGYEEFEVKGSEWQHLKELIIIALKNQTEDNFRRIDDYMQQSLLPDKYKHGPTGWIAKY
jgi:hypothetical protein